MVCIRGSILKSDTLIRAALLAFLVPAAPALAQEWSTVEFMARDLKKDDPAAAYRGAVAACLAGQGDVEKTAKLFDKGGWTRSDETEMGLVEYASPNDDLYVAQADDGSFCAAYAESLGTDVATGALQIVSGAGGLSLETTKGEFDCDAYTLATGVVAEITSSGNDPVCSDAGTSSVRILFGGAQ